MDTVNPVKRVVRRRVVEPSPAEEARAEALVQTFTGTSKPLANTLPRQSLDRAKVRVEEYMRTREGWEDATPTDFVALYFILHKKVYGIEATDITPAQAFQMRTLMQNQCMSTFKNDAFLMAEYMAWIWKREQDREKWRRQNNREGSRLLWRFIFTPENFVQWRLSLERRAQKV